MDCRAAVYRYKGDLDKAIGRRQRGHPSRPETAPRAIDQRGVAYREKGELDKALADLNEGGAA